MIAGWCILALGWGRKRRCFVAPDVTDGTGFLTSVAGAVPSRTVVVLDAIKHAILTGELRPGRGLVETDLRACSASPKPPSREALKTLAGAGLVTMSPY